MAVELALTPDSRWDVDVPWLLAAARSAGFCSLGILADRASAEAAAAYAAAGLRCDELLALLPSDDEAATVAAAERLAGAAAVMGARWVTTVFPRRLDAGLVALLRRCAAVLAEAGAGIAVEFSPLGVITSIGSGLEVVEALGADRAGLLIDTWHFSFGDSTWDDLATVPLDRIAFVQFTDAPEPAGDDLMRETMNRRLPPGEGVLALDRFATTLLERGWAGLVSVEVLNRELRAHPVDDVVRRLHDTAARYWR